MASFRIPKAHHSGLAKLLELDEPAKEKLLSALGDATLASRPEGLAKRVSITSEIPFDTVNSIVTVLVSLNSFRDYMDLPTKEFADQVCEAIIENEDKDLNLSQENRKQFAEYLTLALDARALTVSSKVVDVWVEHQYPFCSAKVFTDIRPVFGGEQGDTLLVTGIVHMLKLNYHEQNLVKDIYIALDDDDLQEIKDALNKASARAESLRSTLKEANIPSFE
jgi:hypothetical protein